MAQPRSGRPAVVLAVAVLICCLVLAGCTGGNNVAVGEDPTPATLASGTEGPSGREVSCLGEGSVASQSVSSQSVATRWIDVALDAIRRDFPAPTIHARNLYHLSAAMFDAWAAYDPDLGGAIIDLSAERAADVDVDAARTTAVTHAAYGILTARYVGGNGAEDSLDAFDALLSACDDVLGGHPDGAALGDQIAAGILAATLEDGANEAGQYDAPYDAVNPPLRVSDPGTTLVDPNLWQPLELDQMVTQNGIPTDSTVQTYVGYQWGQVTPFAIGDPAANGDPAADGNSAVAVAELDPGPPPRLDDADGGAAYREAAMDVLAASSELDPRDDVVIDISPGMHGNNSLGTDDGTGRRLNPITDQPYQPNPVARADYQRAVAEYWADGPTSETPPGHWNTLAGQVSDAMDQDDLLVAGVGAPLDRLEWDVKLYLALNGALHDAAVAAWGVKADYLSVRPISMIRYLGGLGQSSDPDGPSYDPGGLLLQPGLVQVVTSASAAAGGAHEGLADHIGEVAVRAWTPTVATAGDPSARVRWIPASTWVPYQRPTFVTPAFAGYVSGHSTFSRAGADILTAFTGSPFFPGGLGTWTVPAGTLAFEDGPTTDVVLQWATYADAADEAGRSRIYGGIHIIEDDHAGRRLGAEVATSAWFRATQIFS